LHDLIPSRIQKKTPQSEADAGLRFPMPGYALPALPPKKQQSWQIQQEVVRHDVGQQVFWQYLHN